MADKYMLKVTAGPTYDEKDQQIVAVNSEKPVHISSSKLDAAITIRVQNYRGLPKGSPSTSPYFSKAPHTHDLYSLGFSFTPKQDINGHDLVLGNDFDHPIRDKLPPGFGQAMKIVQWFIDPGLYGDAYADEPYLYGPMLSSINTLRVGSKGQQQGGHGGADAAAGGAAHSDADADADVVVVTEGADGDDGEAARHAAKVPDDAAARKKHFLTEQHLRDFVFEEGRSYHCDFFNPYLDFNDFALKLPGFSLVPGITIPIISYWDGQPLRSHSLRYVLKDRSTNKELFVVIFTLVPKDQVDNADDQAEAQKPGGSGSKAGPAAEVKAADDNDDLD
ncbi:hypothetical protein MBLNU459_g4044t3 [Dothideomycetes sp. NU459]